MRIVLVALLAFPFVAAAQEPLVVGTKEAPPFVIQQQDGSWSGMSIELWRSVAESMGVAYRFEERPLDELITGLEDGSLDVSVAALTVTAPREERVDFAHPFYSSGLGIAVNREGGAGWSRVLRTLASTTLLKALALLVAVLFVSGFVVWLFERRHNEQFGGGTGQGLFSAFWWSAVSMTTVGYGDKAPITTGGRIVAMVWIFTSVVIVSSFTASIASALTVAEMDSRVSGPGDLPFVRVATVRDSTSAGYLRRIEADAEYYETAGAALTALARGRVDAVVYDAPILQFVIKENFPERLSVLPDPFVRQDYAFALPNGSTLREPMNRAILSRISSGEWRRLRDQYLGE